jgi:hypothetical protein
MSLDAAQDGGLGAKAIQDGTWSVRMRKKMVKKCYSVSFQISRDCHGDIDIGVSTEDGLVGWYLLGRSGKIARENSVSPPFSLPPSLAAPVNRWMR